MQQYFSGNPLDRAEAARRDAGWLARIKRDRTTKYLPLHRLRIPVDRHAEPQLLWLGSAILDTLGEAAPEPVLLGLQDGAAHFAIDVSQADAASLGLDDGAAFEDARAAAADLPIHETGIIAQAKAQVDWHARHRFCGACGAETEPRRGGHQRHCRSCGADHFPRTDPVIIVLVHHGERCLLGQSHLRAAPSPFYSCLAGFMDHGESIEEAVRREVKEEAGIELGEVTYHASQPWPFPSSLMIGCFAEATTTEIAFDEVEMNDVRWFPRAKVLDALADRGADLKVPGRIAIAGDLIRTWATGSIVRPATFAQPMSEETLDNAGQI